VLLLPAITVLKLDGYRPTPVAGDLRWDAKEAEAMRCEGCGLPGLRFAAFRRPGGGAHRGLACCGSCLTAVEV
jgi:hypothetical protein